MARGREGKERGSEGKRKGEKERRQMFHTGTWGRWALSCSQIPSGKGLGEEKASLAMCFQGSCSTKAAFPPTLPPFPPRRLLWALQNLGIRPSPTPPPTTPSPCLASLYFSRKLLHSHSAQGRGTEPHHRAQLGLHFTPFLGRDPAHPTPSASHASGQLQPPSPLSPVLPGVTLSGAPLLTILPWFPPALRSKVKPLCPTLCLISHPPWVDV